MASQEKISSPFLGDDVVAFLTDWCLLSDSHLLWRLLLDGFLSFVGPSFGIPVVGFVICSNGVSVEGEFSFLISKFMAGSEKKINCCFSQQS